MSANIMADWCRYPSALKLKWNLSVNPLLLLTDSCNDKLQFYSTTPPPLNYDFYDVVGLHSDIIKTTLKTIMLHVDTVKLHNYAFGSISPVTHSFDHTFH